MRRILVLALVLLAPPALAQAPAAVPESFWTEFFSAAKAAGWFGTLVMTFMWWQERGERREMQMLIMGDPAKGGGGLLERFLTAFHNSTDAIKDLGRLFGARKPGE